MDAALTLKKRLGQMLVDADLLSPAAVEQAAREAAEAGRKLGDYVVERGLVTAEALALTLSVQLGVPFLDLLRLDIQPEALRLVPAQFCREHVLIPVERSDASLLVVMSDPANMQVTQELRSMCGLEVR